MCKKKIINITTRIIVIVCLKIVVCLLLLKTHYNNKMYVHTFFVFYFYFRINTLTHQQCYNKHCGSIYLQNSVNKNIIHFNWSSFRFVRFQLCYVVYFSKLSCKYEDEWVRIRINLWTNMIKFTILNKCFLYCDIHIDILKTQYITFIIIELNK